MANDWRLARSGLIIPGSASRTRHPQPVGNDAAVAKAVNKLRKTRACWIRSGKRLQREYQWRDDDLRIAVFVGMANVLTSLCVALACQTYYLADMDWWNGFFGVDEPEAAKSAYGEFGTFLKIGIIQVTVSNLETWVKQLLYELDPSTKNIKKFHSAWESLIRKNDPRLTSVPANAETIFRLWTLIRNTIHWNGFYVPEKERPQTIEYRGVSYEFRVGVQLSFLSWDFLDTVLADTESLVASIVSDPEVSGLGRPLLNKVG